MVKYLRGKAKGQKEEEIKQGKQKKLQEAFSFNFKSVCLLRGC